MFFRISMNKGRFKIVSSVEKFIATTKEYNRERKKNSAVRCDACYNDSECDWFWTALSLGSAKVLELIEDNKKEFI